MLCGSAHYKDSIAVVKKCRSREKAISDSNSDNDLVCESDE